jgi:hypothetical protein
VYTPFQPDFAYKRAATPRTAYPAFKARQAGAILYQKSARPVWGRRLDERFSFQMA